jgi:NTP pyrophosphatase (non-canonical NTP hydrolase)
MLLEDYDWTDDHRKNVEFAYAFIRERVAKGGKGWRGYPMNDVMIDLLATHEKFVAHLFPAYSSSDERFLALGLCGEAGELANMIKKRWRDGADFTEEIRDEIADVRMYLELLAKCFGIEGVKLDERVQQKLQKVVEKHKGRLT